MTRKEAIKTLRNTAWLGTDKKVGQVEEAIQIAIKALEAQDGDAISRQAVMWMLTNLSYNQCKTQGEADLIDTAKTMVMMMQSAQPKSANEPSKTAHIVPNEDFISRKMAIDALGVWCYDQSDERTIDEVLLGLPSAQPEQDMIHLQKEQAYMQGWEEGRKALREELWGDARKSLDR